MLFSVMGALIKALGSDMTVIQIAFFRSLFGLVVMLPFMARAGRAAFATAHSRVHMARSLIGVTAMICGMYALTHLTLADAVSLSFTRPLFVIVLAVLILGEAVRWRRWTATAVGFLGVILMMRPTVAGIDPAALAALAGSLLSAVVAVLIKRMTATESTLTILSWFAAVSTVATLIPSLFVWQTPGWPDLVLLFLVGGLGVVGQNVVIFAYRAGEATAVTPFDYARLLYSGIIGFLFFAETPDAWTLAGAGVIVAATFYIARREAALAHRKQAQPRTSEPPRSLSPPPGR